MIDAIRVFRKAPRKIDFRNTTAPTDYKTTTSRTIAPALAAIVSAIMQSSVSANTLSKPSSKGRIPSLQYSSRQSCNQMSLGEPRDAADNTKDPLSQKQTVY